MNRRDILKVLGIGTAIPEDAIPSVKSVEILKMQPGDTLVLTLDESWPRQEKLNAIKAQLENRFPDQKVLVLTGGMNLSVIKSA